ncbi:MAG TPA: hypothetical protein EYO59_02930 [Chromatiaceae bacterium]|jgi:hypothetical protein|nr:hypothetical protein [Chromatiaceae bacterium]HIO00477.1 hypothetical protein [Alphaproteobacteria bacterium]
MISISKWIRLGGVPVFAVVLLFSQSIFAEATKSIHYQGYLADSTNLPVDATLDIVISLYSDPIDEGSSLHYSETHSAVTISQGRFSLFIGDGDPTAGVYGEGLFTEQIWVGININGETLSPRTRLANTPYSLQAIAAQQFASGSICLAGDLIICYEGDSGTRNIGACQEGTRTCSSGAFGACDGQVLPTIETCNGVDDDCEGTADVGTTIIGCTDYFVDNDQDGAGIGSATCLCASQAGNAASVGGDCDDSDPQVYPGQTNFFTVASAGGTFDYNCSGTIETGFPAVVATCTYNGSSCDFGSGFLAPLPGCGEGSLFGLGCSQSGSTCTVTTGVLGGTQSCQ